MDGCRNHHVRLPGRSVIYSEGANDNIRNVIDLSRMHDIVPTDICLNPFNVDSPVLPASRLPRASSGSFSSVSSSASGLSMSGSSSSLVGDANGGGEPDFGPIVEVSESEDDQVELGEDADHPGGSAPIATASAAAELTLSSLPEDPGRSPSESKVTVSRGSGTWCITLHSVVGRYSHALRPVAELDADSFERKVLQSDDAWVVCLYAKHSKACRNFNRHWKPSCRRLISKINAGQIEAEHTDLILRFDVDVLPALVVRWFHVAAAPAAAGL